MSLKNTELMTNGLRHSEVDVLEYFWQYLHLQLLHSVMKHCQSTLFILFPLAPVGRHSPWVLLGTRPQRRSCWMFTRPSSEERIPLGFWTKPAPFSCSTVLPRVALCLIQVYQAIYQV